MPNQFDRPQRCKWERDNMRCTEMTTNGEYCAYHNQERKRMTMAGSVVGVAATALFTASAPVMLVGAIIGGILGAYANKSEDTQ